MAVTLGSKAVGSIVKLKENGVLQNYIVVHQGKPSSIYDESCNGTWLLRQDCIEKRVWNSTNLNYWDSCTIKALLDSYILAKYDDDIQIAIKQIKIPYKKPNSSTVNSGANGISCKVFLLSACELGWSASFIAKEGAKLAYFSSGDYGDTKTDCIANFEGIPVNWWTRSGTIGDNTSVFYILPSGECASTPLPHQQTCGIRPALIMPQNLMVDDNGTIFINNTPSTPTSISFSNLVSANNTITVSWGSSTDPDGDTVKYQLERSINGSSSWTKVYDGTSLSYTDTISASWNTVQYRVRAYDTYNLYSAYKTSENKTVLRLNISKITVPSMAMQKQQIPISWSNATNADSYTLERNANNSTWESIYTGNNTSYTDTAGTWNTVQYRVKANNNGSFGSYKTSTAIPVITPNALVISGTDSDLGTLTNNVPYTISTDTGNTISLERYVNGQLIAKLEVNSGFNYTIPVIDLPTGTGTIKLVASVKSASGSNVSKTRIWTYNKTPVNFPDTGGVGALTQDGKNVFPPTIAECVRVSAQFGGSLDKALELIAPVLNMAVMAVGSYIGSGTFGQDSPNSLTFDFSPQMVIISGGNKSLTISNTIKTEGGTVGYIEGTKVTWYNGNSADEQLNQSETTYTYIAVGKQV